MGAEPPEFLEEERTTAHHVDVVLLAGQVRIDGAVLLEWE